MSFSRITTDMCMSVVVWVQYLSCSAGHVYVGCSLGLALATVVVGGPGLLERFGRDFVDFSC